MRQLITVIFTGTAFALGISAAVVAAPEAAPSLTPSAQQGEPPAPKSIPSDRVHMATYSWGTLISEWTIYSDGSGQFKSSRQVPNNVRERVVVTKVLGATKGRYDQLTNILRPAESYAGKELPCSYMMTDAPYGQVSWQNERIHNGFGFNYGCTSTEAKKVFDEMGAAEALVAEWAADAPDADEPRQPNPSGSR